MGTVTIRAATTDDVAGVRRVAERGWNATYGDILPAETIDAAMAAWYGADAVYERVQRDDAAYVVAERSGDVVGYASGGPSDEAGVATLGAIYVDPDHWGEGIGTELLDAFGETCRQWGCEAVRAQVLAENDVGVSFYRARGYDVIEERDADLFGETVRTLVFRGPIE